MSISSTHLETAYYILEWAIRIAAVAIVPLRRPPAAARAWLLLIFFLPVPGVLLFLAIGSPRFPKWRTDRFRELRPFFDALAQRLRDRAPADCGAADPIADLSRRLGYTPATGGNTVEMIDDYDGVVDRLVADIDAARRCVRLLVYIFADDEVGQKVAAALGRAVKRGVHCRVMVDPVGSHKWIRRSRALLRDNGVEVVEALPFRLLRDRTRRDMRNHRKLFAIDGSIGYAGSQNLVSKTFRKGVVNRELVVRVTGPVVAEIEAVIRGDWFLETQTLPDSELDIPPATGDAQAQLLPSGSDYSLEGFETLLVWQTHQARERVVIATPYFIPDEDVLGAMRTAVVRGVEVHLVLSEVVDQRMVNLAQRSYYDDLLKAGVHIHLFRNFLLHAKNVSIDGRLAIIGSSNVDLRSFQLNEEASLLLYDAASVAALEKVQRGYLEGSDEVELETWRQRPKLQKLLENLARLVGSLF